MDGGDRVIVSVMNLKGGVGKTTTAAFALHVLHESGLRVLGVDADGENQSLLSWSNDAEFAFPVVGLAVENLHKRLPGITGDQYDAVVIDTPPMKGHRGVVRSAAILASHVVIPTYPGPMEHKRLPAVRELLDEADDLRGDRPSPEVCILLNRTAANAASTGVYREVFAAEGYTVLPGEIRRMERYGQAEGRPVVNATNTAYGDAVASMMGVAA